MKVEEPAPPPAVARLLMGTRLGYITCSGKYRAYLEKRDLYELVSDDGIATPRRMDPPSADETTACVHETVYKAKGLHDVAAKQAGTAAAKAALREYMTAWQASLTSIESKQPEKSPRVRRAAEEAGGPAGRAAEAGGVDGAIGCRRALWSRCAAVQQA